MKDDCQLFLSEGDSAKLVVRILLDVAMAHGVKDVVCSPGSRNAPLLLGAEARKGLKKHIVIDERSAAFTALGIALVSKRPVILICTSGTALLNYAPAIAEAYYQGIPLIVISADRPLEWIDQDDSQTIRQPEALNNFVKGSYDLSDSLTGEKDGWYETRISNDALITALSPKQGPVHINLRLTPPLDEVCRKPIDDRVRIIRKIGPSLKPEKEKVTELAQSLIGKKVMIAAGFLQPDSRLNKAMLRMRLHSNVVVMAETISNLHLPCEDYAVDTLLCDPEVYRDESLFPDIVISCGGALVSRMLKEYLRKCGLSNPKFEHWSVGFNHSTVDCFKALTLRIETDPGYFFQALSPALARSLRLSAPSLSGNESMDFASKWNAKRTLAIARINEFASSAPWSDMAAFQIILKQIHPGTNIFLSNGTCVRYAQIFSRHLSHAEYCNRGVSGIDGSTSTAIGGGVVYQQDTVLITGDMSFSYDLSALQTMKSLNSRLKIIVINNKGGGIFRFIKSTSRLACREKYFCADPQLPIEGIARSYGIEYMSATDSGKLNSALRHFNDASGPAILEVITPAEESAALLREALSRS